MISETNLIIWFNNLFDNCYYVKHNDYPDSIFMFYDLRYTRKLKLSKLENKKCLPPKKISGTCLFEQNWKNKQLWCNYNIIWKYIFDNYSNKFEDIQFFIKERLKHSNLNTLTSNDIMPYMKISFKNNNKIFIK